MTINTNFNINPYYDDFDDTKKHLRLLFKPGYAVQSRELTQIQTLLQNQVGNFGKHVFKNNSKVSGAEQTLQTVTYLKLDNSYANTNINITQFENKNILTLNEKTRAVVVNVIDNDSVTGDPKTILVKKEFGDFSPGDTIKTDENSPVFANVSADGVGAGQMFSVDEGVWFIDGYFVKNNKQTIVLSKYSYNESMKIGFEINEVISTFNDDTSLLDPALSATNYQAPGADRFIVDLVLSKRSMDSTDTTKFIEIARITDGQLITLKDNAEYSLLADEFARRTYDESGNYTVKPFILSVSDNIANTAQTQISLSTGIAYVYGYEIRTKFPQKLIYDKPRDTSNVNNKLINADYGKYLHIKNLKGIFPITNYSSVDVHCVPTSQQSSNTKIGTVSVRSYDLHSSPIENDANTYSYKASVFNININASFTGTVVSATANTIVIPSFSVTDGAYVGAKIRITSGNGSKEIPKTILSFTSNTITISDQEQFIQIPNNSSQFAIDFEFANVKSLAQGQNTADVDINSIENINGINVTNLKDTKLEPPIFKIGDWVSNNSISDLSYYERRLYTAIPVDVSGNIQLSAFSVTNDEQLVLEKEDFIITCYSSGSSIYSVGQVVPLSAISIAGSQMTITNGSYMYINAVVTIFHSSGSGLKTKSVILAPNALGSGTSTSINSGAATVYNEYGQTTISAGSIVKTPGTPQSLYVSDVKRIVSIIDITTSLNITDHYIFDNGQKDSFYDYSSIKLKPNYTAPSGGLYVTYDKYVSQGSGYFTNESYSSYDDIPSYLSSSGVQYELRDCIDFRPVRVTTSDPTVISFGTTNILPKMSSPIICDFEYYLPRIDRIILRKNGVFEALKGQSSINPVLPQNPNDAMTLYILNNPPYVKNTSDISVEYVENKRYTMRDIGLIEKRVENLEYYTSLSLLEQDTLNKEDLSVLDKYGVPRFKNGIIADSFRGQSVMDYLNPDYKASIDINKKELVPSFDIEQYDLQYDIVNSSYCSNMGQYVGIESETVSAIEQVYASETVSINPFNVINYVGSLILSPSSDIWMDTTKGAEVNINLTGDYDAWQFIADSLPLEKQWNSWNDIWYGNPVTESTSESAGYITTTTTTTTQSVTQERTKLVNNVRMGTVTQHVDDKITDVNVIPYMREKKVTFFGTNFKPKTKLTPYFGDDTTSVDNYVARANAFELNIDPSTAEDLSRLNGSVPITIYNSSQTAIAKVKMVYSNKTDIFRAYTIDDDSDCFYSSNLVGKTFGTYGTISKYWHLSGLTISATNNTIVLQPAATGSQLEPYFNTWKYIYIVSGTGAGQAKEILSYNSGTRTFTIKGTWTTNPDTTSVYSLNYLNSSQTGVVCGRFYIPSSTYRTGEKPFILSDNSLNGSASHSYTHGQAMFYSQGLMTKMSNETITTISPTIQSSTLTETQSILRTLNQYTETVDNTPIVPPIVYDNYCSEFWPNGTPKYDSNDCGFIPTGNSSDGNDV